MSGPRPSPPSEPSPGSGDDAGSGLSHVAADGTARMVDVGAKAVTERRAVARGTFRTTAEVVAAIFDGRVAKGDVLATARIAGIMGAKRTPDLVPLCHPVALTSVGVEFTLGVDVVTVTATAATADRTGVEMEALTAVAVAGLTLHDMVKALDPRARMTDVEVLEKRGGRHGEWRR